VWRCEACLAVYEHWLALCSQCGAWRAMVPAPVHAPAQAAGGAGYPGPRARGALITAQALAAMDRTSLPLAPKWRALFGSLPAVFGLMVYGPAGGGKSTWLLTLCNELARFGDVLYVASEEGQANSMIEKLSRLEIVSTRIHISSAITMHELLEDLGKASGARFLMIDSLTCFPLTVVELSQLAEKHRLGVGFSLHARKDKGFVGASTLNHWVDLTARIEGGAVALEKNRFGPLKTLPLEFGAGSGAAGGAA